MSSNVYYDPEDFDLKIVATHEFSGGVYEFDTRVIWETKDGRFLTARSSGCSCPCPFEEYSKVEDLEDFSESYLIEEAREVATDSYGYEGDPIEPWITEIRDIAREIKK